jgi:hypothetical protein
MAPYSHAPGRVHCIITRAYSNYGDNDKSLSIITSVLLLSPRTREQAPHHCALPHKSVSQSFCTYTFEQILWLCDAALGIDPNSLWALGDSYLYLQSFPPRKDACAPTVNPYWHLFCYLPVLLEFLEFTGARGDALRPQSLRHL